jgi:hypothetical protein
MKYICLALALATAGPAVAAQPEPAAPAAKPAIDPERLALAKQAVAAIMPAGTMQRVMKDSLGYMEEMMLGGMFDMKGTDLGVTGEGKDKTLRQVMAEKDPHFEERMRITNRVMTEEMSAIFGRMEPRMREGMARAYARRFTVAELTDINRFFVSPAGASFARQSFELMTDPELMTEMMSFMPEMMKEMPAMGEKLKKATAHLPPPPKDKDKADGKGEKGAEDDSADPVA